MQHDFNKEELSRWFVWNYTCWWCGRSHANCFHHIQGRSSAFADSILNAAPLNNFECHLPIHGKIRRKEYRVNFLQKTLSYLLPQGYELTEKDKGFIRDFQEEYHVLLAPSVHLPVEMPQDTPRAQ